MMAYAFQGLSKSDYEKLKTERFENALNLFAAILSIGLRQLVKSGLIRDYLEIQEDTSNPKGKIDVSESIKRNTMVYKRLHCIRDEYTENALLNRILKSVANELLKSSEVEKKYKIELHKSMRYFSNVDVMNIKEIAWNRISYYRNNLVYKALINVCFLASKGLLQKQETGTYDMVKYIDNQNLHALFEQFVLKYYQKHFSTLDPSSPHIKWQIDDGMDELLPKMKTDMVLSKNNLKLIIDTKLYENILQQSYGVFKQRSSNLYQIYAYVKNEDKDRTGNVSGVLLYLNNDNSINPDKDYLISGNRISVKSINLNGSFDEIEHTLNSLPEQFIVY